MGLTPLTDSWQAVVFVAAIIESSNRRDIESDTIHGNCYIPVLSSRKSNRIFLEDSNRNVSIAINALKRLLPC